MIIPGALLYCALEILLSDLILKGMQLLPCAFQACRKSQGLCNYLIAGYFK